MGGITVYMCEKTKGSAEWRAFCILWKLM